MMVAWLMVMCYFSIVCTNMCHAQDADQQISQQQQLQLQQEQQNCQICLDYQASSPFFNIESMTSDVIEKFLIHNQNDTDIYSWRLQFSLMGKKRISSEQDIISNNVRLVPGQFQNDVVLEWQANNETNYIRKGGQLEVDWISSKEFSGRNFNLSTPSEVQFNNLKNCQQFGGTQFNVSWNSKIQVWYRSNNLFNARQEGFYSVGRLVYLYIVNVSDDVYNLKDLMLQYYFSDSQQTLECIEYDDLRVMKCSDIKFEMQTNISSIQSAQNVIRIGFREGAGQLINYQKQEKAQQKGLHAYTHILIHFYILSKNPSRLNFQQSDFSDKPSPMELYVFNEKIQVFVNGQQIAGISPWQQAEQDNPGVMKCTDCRIHVTYCCNDKKQLIGDFLSVPGFESINLPLSPTSKSNRQIPIIIIVIIAVGVLLFVVFAYIIAKCGSMPLGIMQQMIDKYKRRNQQTINKFDTEGGQAGNHMETQTLIEQRPADNGFLYNNARQGEVELSRFLPPQLNSNTVPSLPNNIHIQLYDEQIGNPQNGIVMNNILQDGAGDIILTVSFNELQNNGATPNPTSQSGGAGEYETLSLLQARQIIASMQIQEISLDIDLGRQYYIGCGGYGKVFMTQVTKLGRRNGINAEYVAVKESFRPCTNATDFKEILKEAEVMRALESPLIVKIYGVAFKCEQNGALIYPCIVMEYVPGGTLTELFKKEKYKFNKTSLQWKLDILIQIANSIKYLHSQNVIHQDIKSDNILVEIVAGIPKIKISDFGLSKFKESSRLTSGNGGTLNYMSPEQFDGHVAKSSDIWGLGVIMQECLVGQIPWQGLEVPHIKAYVMKQILTQEGPKLENLEQMCELPELYNLILRCWDFHISYLEKGPKEYKDERPKASEIVEKLVQIRQDAQDAQI